MIKLNNMVMKYAIINKTCEELVCDEKDNEETLRNIIKLIDNNPTNLQKFKKYADLIMEACYSDSEDKNFKSLENVKDLTELTYDLNSFCNVIHVAKKSNDYKKLKSKMNYDRKNGNLVNNKNNGGKKYYYDYATLLNYTKKHMPEYHEIFKNSK